MFLTYWLFNTYVFTKQQQIPTQERTRKTESQRKEGLSKPLVINHDEQVIITSDYPEGEIRYTFDGTEPNREDELYQGPIQLSDPDQIYKVKVFYNNQESNTAVYTKDLEMGDIHQSSDTKLVTLRNDRLKLVLSPKGGVIYQAFVKDYKMGDDKVVQIIPEGATLGNMKIESVREDLSNLIYFKEVTKNSVKFYLKDSNDQIILAKEYILGENYQVDFNVSFAESYQHDYVINVPGIADTENLKYKETHPEKYFKSKAQDYKLIALDTNEIFKATLAKLESKEYQSETDNVKWVAARSKYFVISLFSDKIIADKRFEGSMGFKSPAFDMIIENSDFQYEYEHFYFYLGPIEKDFIETFDPSLSFDRVIERSWTWLHWLSKLFEIVIKGLAQVIPNYGVVIIIFALLIKLLLYPLTHKSFENSIKMQKVQPYLTEIQKKYKSDPMKMQQEMSKIKKEHGVSTLGGCLPMLIQMPIFFALYPALRYSIALRGASFVWWLQDLSTPDPYYVLPIIMGIFMFIQQRMMTSAQQNNSANMDEKQQAMVQSQKMMAYILPVMMFFFFRNLPSGLVLYWTVFNILSIIQQHFINKKFRGQ